MNCKNCIHWVFGRCTVSNLIVGPGQLCNAWELSQSHEFVETPFATFDEEELQRRIAELEAAQRWIPVSERLPERQGTTYLNARYLVLYRGYYHDINVFSPSNKKWLCGEVDKTEYVTHWMDIPDLPEEVQE